MYNPFDLERDDAKFVDATQIPRQREERIFRLSLGRNWLLAALSLQSLFMGVLLLLDWRRFIADSGLQLLGFPCTIAAFYHMDLQVKFLKATRTRQPEINDQPAQPTAATDALQSARSSLPSARR